MSVLASIQGLQVGPAERPRLSIAGELRLPRGHCAILGPSGSGKTTLIEQLVGFPSGGGRGETAVRWSDPDGGDISCDPRSGERPCWAWAPTDSGHWPGIPAWQQVALSRPGAGRRPTPTQKQYAENALQAFDLGHVASAAPERMSAGERTRLLTVRALATGAPVLLLDEPFAHVSAAVRPRYREELLRRAEAQGSTLVFSTHDPEAVLHLARQVICLEEGRMVFEGDVETLHRTPPSLEVGQQLGPLNWQDPGEWAAWTGVDAPGHPAVRPEALAIAPSPTGAGEVVTARFQGAVEELRLRRNDGVEATFHHRPPRPGCPPGARVALQLLGVILCALLESCGGAGPAADLRPDVIRSLPPHDGGVPAPRGLAPLADGGLLILDTVGRVVHYGPDGNLVQRWLMPDTSVGRPEGLCELPDGTIAVADTHYHRVVVFGPNGAVVRMFGSQGKGPGQFGYPVTICTDGLGHLYVGEYGGNDRVQKFTVTGEHLLTFGPPGGPTAGSGPGQLQRPAGIAWREGLVYVADAVNHRVVVFTDGGEPQGLVTPPPGVEPLRFPYDLCFDGQGRLLTVEHDAGRVTAFTPTGDGWQVAWRIGSPGRGQGQLATPWGLAVDRPVQLPDDNTRNGETRAPRLWIADTGNRRLVGVPLP